MSHATFPTVISLALPLGNPKDISLRAVEALQAADFIYCEDKRKVKFLCSALDISLKADVNLRVVPGNSEWDEDWNRLEEEAAGKNVLMMSDAGTPVLNDPGAAIARHARSQGWPFVALPGPSAPTLALQQTGGFGLPLLFYGFAPRGTGPERKDFKVFLQSMKSAGTFICFDTRHQILKTLQTLCEAGEENRELSVLKDMTKEFEGEFSGTVLSVRDQIDQHLQNEGGIGELTLVFKGSSGDDSSSSEGRHGSLEEWLSFRKSAPRQAAKILSEKFGLKSQESYKLVSGKDS